MEELSLGVVVVALLLLSVPALRGLGRDGDERASPSRDAQLAQRQNLAHASVADREL